MKGDFKVITMCGSTKFKNEFLQEQKRLTLEGNIVFSVGFFEQCEGGAPLTPAQKKMLDAMHRRKIDMSDEIFVVNKDGYIGESTSSEIEYAIQRGVKVKYMEAID